MLFYDATCIALTTVVLIAYLVSEQNSSRLKILLLGSIVFYSVSGPAYLILLVVLILINFSIGNLIANSNDKLANRWLVFIVVLNLTNLFSFKYTGFVAEQIGLTGIVSVSEGALRFVLPAGISFYTFQLIAYQVDLKRRIIAPSKNIFEFATFVLFFPQLIAGPIMRGQEFFGQLRELNNPTVDDLRAGVGRFLLGFIKKVVIVNSLVAPQVDSMFGNLNTLTATEIWIATFLFGFQIYLDFSGYCDMAIGIARLFGIRLCENFRTPYLACSPAEFWKRWNITLSEWIRDYVYIPLGGGHGSFARTTLNAFAAMLLCGVWHGAAWGFIIWGGVHGLIIFGGKILSRIDTKFKALPRFRLLIGWALTFVAVQAAWFFFRVTSPNEIMATLPKLFVYSEYKISDANVVTISLILVLLGGHMIENRILRNASIVKDVWITLPAPMRGMVCAIFMIVLLPFLLSGNDAPFLYFRF